MLEVTAGADGFATALGTTAGCFTGAGAFPFVAAGATAADEGCDDAG